MAKGAKGQGAKGQGNRTTTTPARVYVAHPMSCYGSPYTAACFDALAGLLPEARLVNPSTIFASDAEWRRAWPRLVGVLGGFVMFGAEDGTIGAGCIGELADSIAVGVPIAGFELGRGLREIRGYDVIDPGTRSPRRAAILRLGGCLDPNACTGESSGGYPDEGDDDGSPPCR
jgi:hypothetical protein